MSSQDPKGERPARFKMPAHPTAKALPCVEEIFEFAGTRLSLRKPREPDDLLDLEEVHQAFEHDEYMPYWASLWASAKFLARHVLSQHLPIRPGARALELGCGLGLPGLAALAAGYDVTFSDYDETAIWFAAENAERNGFANYRTTAIDWRDPPDERFELILGSDLIYEARNCEPLVHALTKLLAPGGTALAADQNRPYAEEFKRALVKAGMRWREIGVGPDLEVEAEVKCTIYVITCGDEAGRTRSC